LANATATAILDPNRNCVKYTLRVRFNARHLAGIADVARRIFAEHQIAELVASKSSRIRADNLALVSAQCRLERAALRAESSVTSEMPHFGYFWSPRTSP